MKKPLILLVGPSGSGKNYLCNCLNLKSIASYTTRPIRATEKHGLEHMFVKYNAWEKIHAKKESLAAWTQYHGHYYWTTIDQVENSKNDIYIIDPAGVKNLLWRKKMEGVDRNFHIVYLKVGMIKRIKNMLARKDNIKSIFDRLKHDYRVFSKFEKEIKNSDFFSAKIIRL